MSIEHELSDTNLSPTPKLSLFSLPNHTPDPPSESVTPPFQTPASVPFKWEEIPGKPRRGFAGDGDGGEGMEKPKAARCLELPPGKVGSSPSPRLFLDGPEPSFRKMLGDDKVTYTPSPSSVLDGPCSGPKVSKTTSFSFRKLLRGEGKITNAPSPSSVLSGLGSGPKVSKTTSFSFRKVLKGEGKMAYTPSPGSIPDGADPGPDPTVSQTTSLSFRGPEEGLVLELVGEEKVNFSSLRWGSEKGFEEDVEGNFDFSSPVGTRTRKRSGFWVGVATSRANFYKNVKQVVPWKRRQDKRRKTDMS